MKKIRLVNKGRQSLCGCLVGHIVTDFLSLLRAIPALIFVNLFLAGGLSAAETAIANDFLKTTITPFKDGKKAAITLTFDDGTLDHFQTGIPLLDKYGFKGTFFLVVKWTKESAEERYLNGKKNKYMTWDEWKEMIRHGHEVGNHSMTHYQLVKANRFKFCYCKPI